MPTTTATTAVSVPNLRGPIPGPAAQKLIEFDEHYTSPSYTRFYPLVVKSGRGCCIEDLDGNLFLDMTAGIAVTTTGHCHPRVVAAIQQQAAQLLHICGADFYYPVLAELANKLAVAAPGNDPKRVLFTNSGAEAIEAAIKLVRYHSRRPHIVAFYGGFHGRTMGALSLTASKLTQRRRFEPLLSEVSHMPYGNCFRCPLNLTYPSCNVECVTTLEKTLFKQKISPDQVAAIVVEPIQGEGGYVVPPPEYHRAIRELCDRHGILLVADEIQSGMGRTGKMFAIEHWGVEPDIICVAKGLASGLPLGAIIAKDSVMDWPPGAHASTFGGNPVACAAAVETMALLEEELLENAVHMGDALIAKLQRLTETYPQVVDVRGKGLMIGVEICTDRETLTPAPELRDAILQKCFQHGLLLLGCGETTVRFCPPLVISLSEVETAAAIFEQAVRETVGCAITG